MKKNPAQTVVGKLQFPEHLLQGVSQTNQHAATRCTGDRSNQENPRRLGAEFVTCLFNGGQSIRIG